MQITVIKPVISRAKVMKSGITLMELLIVMAMLGFMAAISAPRTGAALSMSRTLQTTRSLAGAIRLSQQAALIHGDTREVIWLDHTDGYRGFRYVPFNAPTEEVRVEPDIVFSPAPPASSQVWVSVDATGNIMLHEDPGDPGSGNNAIIVRGSTVTWKVVIDGREVRVQRN